MFKKQFGFGVIRFFLGDTPTGSTTETETTTTPEAPETTTEETKTTGVNGFPENTPIKDMTDAEQAAYWKHQSRKHENQWKNLSTQNEELREKAAKWDEQVEASKSEAEKAVEQARAEGREAALAEMGARLARTELSTALKLRGLPEEMVDAVVSPLNLTEFLTNDREVDAGKVSAYAEQFGTQVSSVPRQPATGQGTTTPAKRGRGVQSGRDLYASRHKSK